MNESGDKLGAAYRALGREEPRAATDEAILAASRRALAKPSLSRRWAAPVSIAAVLVLAFGITLHMREESPGIESPSLDAARPRASGAITPAPEQPKVPGAFADRPTESNVPPPAKKLKAPAKPDREPPRAVEERERSPRAQAAPAPERKDIKTEAASIAPPPLEKNLEPEAANAAQARAQKEADVRQAPMPQAIAPAAPAARMQAAPPVARAPASSADAMQLKRAETPAAGARALVADEALDPVTRELEAIAKLRAAARDEEADKALEEFRRKHPGYRIPDAMWERVKPR